MVTAAPAKQLPPEIAKALARMSEISSLPEVTTKIVRVVEDPRATAHDMHEIVRTDPGLAAKILKVVNSAFYGLPSQIGSLDRAILMLGLSAVKNIALAASLSRLFNVDAVSDQFTARDVWRHSVAVGVCARLLATAGGKIPADEAFVAGLVHDMGLIAAQQLYPARLREAVEQCQNLSMPFINAESALIGVDHQALGGALAAKWRFPPALLCAISYHHEPLTLAQPEFRALSGVVYVADTLCCSADFGFGLTARNQSLDPDMLKILSLTQAQIDELLLELPSRVEEAERVFAD
jgi:HD-like signal output (HDOD) protein